MDRWNEVSYPARVRVMNNTQYLTLSKEALQLLDLKDGEYVQVTIRHPASRGE